MKEDNLDDRLLKDILPDLGEIRKTLESCPEENIEECRLIARDLIKQSLSRRAWNYIKRFI